MILDIIAVVFLLFSALIAYKRGFVKTFFGFVSVMLAIILACVFSKPVATRIKESTEMDEWIIESIVSIGENTESSQDKEFTILSGDNISGEIIIEQKTNESLNDLSSNNSIIEFIETLPEAVGDMVDIEEFKNQTILNVATKISDVVINILAWTVIYFAVRIIVSVITVIFNGIMNLPILKSINNLAGLVIGIVLGIFRIYLILAIIYFISSITSLNFFVNLIQESMIVNSMYNNNLIINLIF